MHPIPVRLPPDLITWLDQARQSEPRSTVIRQILRDEQRRRERAEARAARQLQQARP
jgi:Arc/MetJ-type ribon-helix-helix transcriptional regulator